MSLGILVLLIAAVWFWMRTHGRSPYDATQDGDIDHDVLEAAEDEVRDLDAFTSPDEADDQLPDWGPGTAKP